MAKGRKKKHGGKKKGRRMGAVKFGGNPILMGLLGAKAGDLVNGIITAQLAKATKPPSPWLIAGGQGVLGFLAMTRSRNPLIQGMGVSFLFAGGMNVLNQTGVLRGIGRTGNTYKVPITNGNGNGNGMVKELPILNGRKMGQTPHWTKVLSGVGMV